MWSVTHIHTFRGNLPSPSSGSPFCPEDAGICSPGTLVRIYQSTRCRNAEDRNADTRVRTPNLTIHGAFQLQRNAQFLHLSVTGMETSTMSSSRSALVWTLVMLTAFCCEVRAAPQAFSRLHSDSDNIPIPPAVLQELQYLGLSETVLQVSHRSIGESVLHVSHSSTGQSPFYMRVTVLQVSHCSICESQFYRRVTVLQASHSSTGE